MSHYPQSIFAEATVDFHQSRGLLIVQTEAFTHRARKRLAKRPFRAHTLGHCAVDARLVTINWLLFASNPTRLFALTCRLTRGRSILAMHSGSGGG